MEFAATLTKVQTLADLAASLAGRPGPAHDPRRWIGKVTVHTQDGRTLHGRVDEPVPRTRAVRRVLGDLHQRDRHAHPDPDDRRLEDPAAQQQEVAR